MSCQDQPAAAEIPPSLAVRERLERHALILSLLDALRQQSGDGKLGKSLECLILRQELRDLEDLDGQPPGLNRPQL